MTAAPPVALPARTRKRLAALGHHLALYAEALTVLRGRLSSGKLPEGLEGHALLCFDWLPQGGMPERFEVNLAIPEQEVEGWLVAPEAQPFCATDAACALLHLPGLRRLWASWLRGSVLEDLRRRLPRAWVPDRAAMPPFGAIAGLGIAEWVDLTRLRGSGRAFRIRFADGRPDWHLDAAQDATIWAEAADQLARARPGAALVVEKHSLPSMYWRTEYARSEGRWEMTGLTAGG